MVRVRRSVRPGRPRSGRDPALAEPETGAAGEFQRPSVGHTSLDDSTFDVAPRHFLTPAHHGLRAAPAPPPVPHRIRFASAAANRRPSSPSLLTTRRAPVRRPRTGRLPLGGREIRTADPGELTGREHTWGGGLLSHRRQQPGHRPVRWSASHRADTANSSWAVNPKPRQTASTSTRRGIPDQTPGLVEACDGDGLDTLLAVRGDHGPPCLSGIRCLASRAPYPRPSRTLPEATNGSAAWALRTVFSEFASSSPTTFAPTLTSDSARQQERPSAYDQHPLPDRNPLPLGQRLRGPCAVNARQIPTREGKHAIVSPGREHNRFRVHREDLAPDAMPLSPPLHATTTDCPARTPTLDVSARW